jgi:tetratricopeptide (TPR) repeat protein
MKKLLLSISLILFCCNFSFSDEMKFVILTSNGDVSLIRNLNIFAVKTGEKIYDNDKLKVGKKSYLNLVYKDGKTLEIKTAGTYNITKLITMVNSKKNSSAKKFSNYILAEFAKSVDDLGNMRVTGAVERLIKTSIDYCTPPNTSIMDPVVTLTWYSVPGNSYTLKLTDLSANVLYSTELNDTSMTVNLQQLNLSRDNNYKWFVKDNKREKALIDTCRFYWLSQSKADSIKKSVKKLLTDLDKLDHSIKQTILASFYFGNRLYIDMVQAYERAIELSPDNDTYKSLYLSALNRIGLTRKAASFKSQQKVMSRL